MGDRLAQLKCRSGCHNGYRPCFVDVVASFLHRLGAAERTHSSAHGHDRKHGHHKLISPWSQEADINLPIMLQVIQSLWGQRSPQHSPKKEHVVEQLSRCLLDAGVDIAYRWPRIGSVGKSQQASEKGVGWEDVVGRVTWHKVGSVERGCLFHSFSVYHSLAPSVPTSCGASSCTTPAELPLMPVHLTVTTDS